MRLSALKIRNHSRVVDLDVEVRDHLVLVGTNESGKSSILRCIDLLLGAPRARLYATLTAADVRDPARPFVVEVTLTGAERAVFPDMNAAGAVRLRLDVHVGADGETLDIHRRVVTGDGGAELTAAQLAAIGWTMMPDDADLHAGDMPMLRRLFATLDLGDERRALVQAEHAADGALRRSGTLRTLRERIAGQLTAALPGCYRGDDLVFVATAREDDPFDRVRLRLRGPNGQRDLGAQSGGLRAVFVVALFDLLDDDAGVIGIDEPETHLHPTSQRNLARLLARGPSQKIIATHSPDIIGEFEPDEIAVVRTDDVVQPQRDFLDDDDKLLLRMWVRDRLEPLTAEHVVVVEGITDRVLLEHCADVTGRNLDTYGVVVLEAGGCREMPAWRHVFGEHGFRVPLTQLIDADAADAIAHDYGVRVGDLPAQHVWVSYPDLEGEYVRALGANAAFDALARGGFRRGELEEMRRRRRDGTLKDADVARFCRMRANKTRAVLAVMPAIDAAVARRIASVQRLLNDVVRTTGGATGRPCETPRETDRGTI